MRAFLLFGIFLTVPGTLLSQTASTGAGEVAGHVTCADSHTPCRFASVTMQSAPPEKQGIPAPDANATHTYAAATDLEGAFAMKGVVPGEYYITALEPGYLSPYDLAASEFEGDPALKPQAVEIALQRISVASGQTTPSNLLLSRGASLSGTVRYDDGGVGIQLSIHLFRKDGTGKWQTYTNTAGTGDLARLGFGPKTDDRGRFYAPGLPPGSYLVQAELPLTALLLSTITGRQSIDIKMTNGDALQVYYGDVYRIKLAKPIELHAGEDRTDMDINIPTSGLHRLHGIVTAPDGQAMATGKVRLLDPDDKAILRETQLQPEGAFSFENVVSGSYLIQIESAGKPSDSKAASRLQTLTTPLLVENDLPSLTYRLTPAK